MASTTNKKNNKKGQVPTAEVSSTEYVPAMKSATVSAFSRDVSMGNAGDSGDDGRGGNDEEYESDNDSLTLEEKKEYEERLAEGASNAGNGSNMEKIPSYILGHYKKLYPTFEKFWTNDSPFAEKVSKESNEGIKKLIRTNGGDPSQTMGVLPFNTFVSAKRDALAHFKNSDKMDRPALLKAWSTADKTITDMRQQLDLSGFPKEFGPPEDWIEQVTGLRRSGDEDDSLSTTSGESLADKTAATSISDEQWNPDADDSIEELSRACGAKLPLLSADGEVCGYSRRGGHHEVLVKQGKDTNVRYRLVPAKAAVAFDPSKPNCPNLAIGQRGSERDQETGAKLWHAKHVKALKAVAWRQDEVDGDDPIKEMRHTGEGRQSFPVTRVKILWSDNKETWETRTTLRALYPRETADAMIYQRAGIQEARYRRGQGLPDLKFKRIKLPSIAPAFSNSAPSRRSSRKSRSTTASRVSFDDDDSDREEPRPRAFSKVQKAELEQMLQGLTQTLMSALSVKGGR